MQHRACIACEVRNDAEMAVNMQTTGKNLSVDQIESAKKWFMEAMEEVERLQRKFWSVFTTTFGCSPRVGLGKDWARVREGVILEGNQWRCVFHGVECDVYHRSDPRCIRLELLLDRAGAVSWRGMSIFLETSRPPWKEFPMLRELLNPGVGPAYSRFALIARELVETGQLLCVGP